MFSKLKITFDCWLTLHLQICEFLIIVHVLLEASLYYKMPPLPRYLYKEYDVLKYSMSLSRFIRHSLMTRQSDDEKIWSEHWRPRECIWPVYLILMSISKSSLRKITLLWSFMKWWILRDFVPRRRKLTLDGGRGLLKSSFWIIR